MKLAYGIIVMLLIPVFALQAQEKDSVDIIMGYIKDNDTIIHKNIPEVWVIPKNMSKRQKRRYSRYVQKVKKVYPLAKEAKELLIKYEPEYASLEKQRDKRKLMKRLEKELLAEHKNELKKWSISDGRILIKLIDRETERTAYSIIRDFRGEVSALFWQGIARIFKNNLKDDFDPYGDDRMLEEIVTLIELGYL